MNPHLCVFYDELSAQRET